MSTFDTSRKIAQPVCYSSELNYIFIHIPKCAGTSMHRALAQLHKERALPLPARQYHKHTKAPEVRRVLGPMWEQAFKFSFVRNPWDLMVSSYHWWLSYAGGFASLARPVSEIRKLGSFRAFLESDFGLVMLNEQPGRDLLEWITEGGEVIVDFVGRYESLDRDWEQVCQRLKVQPIPLSRQNHTPRPHYRSFYDEVSRELVGRRFAKSIELFGYEF